MSKKIPQEYNDVIYEEYDKLLAVGVPVLRIAELVNEKLGTQFPESSLRGRYKHEKLRREGADLQKRLLRLAEADIKLRYERKVIGKERSVINGLLRENVDRRVVVDMCVQLWGEEPLHQETTRLEWGKSVKSHGFSFSDPHYGYRSTMKKNIYNPEVTAQRIRKMFDYIIKRTLDKGYDKIFISDQGDDIEGSALRVSQLVNIAEDMTKKAYS